MNTMQPLWLDYQRPFPGRHWPGFLLLGAGLLLFGGLLMHSFSLADEIAASEKQVLRLKREIDRQRLLAETGKPATGAPDGAPGPTSPSAARWEALLLALESASDDSLTLLAIEPGPREISISGEARDLGASLDYVKRLQNFAVFADVHLVRHQLLTENPYRPVRFALSARWRGSLP
jgi:hypothetical protein